MSFLPTDLDLVTRSGGQFLAGLRPLCCLYDALDKGFYVLFRLLVMQRVSGSLSKEDISVCCSLYESSMPLPNRVHGCTIFMLDTSPVSQRGDISHLLNSCK